MKKALFLSLVLTGVVLVASASLVLAAPGDVTDPETLKELAASRRATTKYHDVNSAIGAGYLPFSPHIPGMGAHYVNFGLLDPLFDLARPEILLYSLAEGDRPKLIAVEYVVAGPAPDGFSGGDDVWDLHRASCHYTDDTEALCPVPASPGDDHDGKVVAFWHPDLWALHVWLWEGNPNGIFTMFNPNIP